MRLLQKSAKFHWILPTFYVLAAMIYLLAIVLNIGHTPRGIEPLFHFLAAPCYLIDLLPSWVFLNSMLFEAVFCIGFALLTYFLIGALIDLIVKKFRRPNA